MGLLTLLDTRTHRNENIWNKTVQLVVAIAKYVRKDVKR